MSYPNADMGSLANYYLASQQLAHERAEYITELKTVIRLLLAVAPVTPDLYARARAALEEDSSSE